LIVKKHRGNIDNRFSAANCYVEGGYEKIAIFDQHRFVSETIVVDAVLTWSLVVVGQ